MKEKAVIKIEKREIANSRDSKRLRSEGYLPGSVFGKGLETFSVKTKESDFRKSLHKFGRNYLYTIDLEGKKKYTVMLKDIQQDPITGQLLNVNFHQVSLSDEMKTTLETKILGREEVEKRKLLVVKQLDLIPVSGLPKDIPDHIEIDVTGLELGDHITTADINFPKGITAEIEPDYVILSINDATAQFEEEEDSDETIEAAADSVEVIGESENNEND